MRREVAKPEHDGSVHCRQGLCDRRRRHDCSGGGEYDCDLLHDLLTSGFWCFGWPIELSSRSAPSASSRTTSAAGTHIAFVEYVHPATARAFKYADIYTVDA